MIVDNIKRIHEDVNWMDIKDQVDEKIKNNAQSAHLREVEHGCVNAYMHMIVEWRGYRR